MSTSAGGNSISELVAAAKPTIRTHEGYEPTVYHDSLGIPTIGIGFNLLDDNARTLCANCGADYDAVLASTEVLTDAQIEYLYSALATAAVQGLIGIFPALFSYTQNRQIALLDMAFNLGIPRFSLFRMMISAVLADDWATASAQALDSAWAREVGERAQQDADWLKYG